MMSKQGGFGEFSENEFKNRYPGGVIPELTAKDKQKPVHHTVQERKALLDILEENDLKRWIRYQSGDLS